MKYRKTVKARYFITIFLCLMFISTGCGSKKEKSPGGRPELKSTPAEGKSVKTFDAGSVTFKKPFVMLGASYKKWSLARNPRYFNPENLADLINGASDSYLAYGFAGLVAADYVNGANPEQAVTAEIYDMGTTAGAFGRFSRFIENMQDPSLAGDGLAPPVKQFGKTGLGDLLFWKDRFLVHLTIMDENPEASAAGINKTAGTILPFIAAQIFKAIPGEARLPAELSLFPQKGLIPRSHTRAARKLQGYSVLNGGFSARYKIDKYEFTLFLSDKMADEKSAAKAADSVAGLTPAPLMVKAAGSRVAGVLNDGEEEPPVTVCKPLLDELAASSAALKSVAE